jgi:hypothetical protein
MIAKIFSWIWTKIKHIIMAFNVDFDKINITVIQGDTWSQTYSVKRNNVLYDMTGMQLDLEVKDEDDVTVFALSSAGGSPALTITGTAFTIFQLAAFDTVGKYYYDLQLTNATKVSTICRGYITVLKEYTD